MRRSKQEACWIPHPKCALGVPEMWTCVLLLVYVLRFAAKPVTTQKCTKCGVDPPSDQLSTHDTLVVFDDQRATHLIAVSSTRSRRISPVFVRRPSQANRLT